VAESSGETKLLDIADNYENGKGGRKEERKEERERERKKERCVERRKETISRV